MSKTCLTLFNQAQLGELTALPQTRWLDLRHLLVRGGRGGEGREGKKGREGGWGRQGREGRDKRVGEKGRGKGGRCGPGEIVPLLLGG